MRLDPDVEVLGVRHVGRRILLDQRGAAAVALEHHRGLLAGEVGERLEVAVAFPALGRILREVADELQRLDHLPGGHLRAILLVEEHAAVRLHQLAEQDVDEEVVAGDGDARHAGGIERLGVGNEVRPGLRRLEAGLLREVLTIDEQGRPGRMYQPILRVADAADALHLVPDVLLTERLDHLVERQQQAFGLQRGAGDRLAVRELRRRARGERLHDLGLEVSPRQRLDLDLHTGILRLEAPGDVLHRFLRVGLRLGVPDANDLLRLRCRNDEREQRRGDDELFHFLLLRRRPDLTPTEFGAGVVIIQSPESCALDTPAGE